MLQLSRRPAHGADLQAGTDVHTAQVDVLPGWVCRGDTGQGRSLLQGVLHLPWRHCYVLGPESCVQDPPDLGVCPAEGALLQSSTVIVCNPRPCLPQSVA